MPSELGCKLHPPVVVSDKGDVYIFATTRQAEASLEPIDIRNHEYEIFDSKGQHLDARVIQTERSFLLFKTKGERVVLEVKRAAAIEGTPLRNILIQFLSKVGEDRAGLEKCDLSALVDKASKVMPSARRRKS
jgi:hypothetical protein